MPARAPWFLDAVAHRVDAAAAAKMDPTKI
jgi:hypothetical protein